MSLLLLTFTLTSAAPRECWTVKPVTGRVRDNVGHQGEELVYRLVATRVEGPSEDAAFRPGRTLAPGRSTTASDQWRCSLTGTKRASLAKRSTPRHQLLTSAYISAEACRGTSDSLVKKNVEKT